MRPLVLTVLPLLTLTAARAQELALRGLDPVLLCEGDEAEGDADRTEDLWGYRYRFASPETLARFRDDPERYSIQMGGGCARMGPLSGRGSPDRWAVWDGRIYIFASDACRKGFLAAPERHVGGVERVPDATAEQYAAGAELLRRAVQAVGGAEAVDAVKTVRLQRRKTVESGGRAYRYRESWQAELPDRARHEVAWDDDVWAKVATFDDAWFADGDGVRTMAPVQRREFLGRWRRQVLPLLHARRRFDFVATAVGPVRLAGVEGDGLTVAFDGTVTTLALGPDARVLAMAWRGRIGGPIGAVEVRCEDHRLCGALSLPHRTSLWFDGEPVKDEVVTWDRIEVDVELPPTTFAR